MLTAESLVQRWRMSSRSISERAAAAARQQRNDRATWQVDPPLSRSRRRLETLGLDCVIDKEGVNILGVDSHLQPSCTITHRQE